MTTGILPHAALCFQLSARQTLNLFPQQQPGGSSARTGKSREPVATVQSTMEENWSDMSPGAQMDKCSCFHPALRRNSDGASVAEHANVPCPGAPVLGPAPDPGNVRALRGRTEMPPALNLDDVDPMTLHLPQPPGSLWSYRWPGPSPRLYWALFAAWRHRWSYASGLSLPLVAVLAIYVRGYLFLEESPQFLASLQQFLQTCIPLGTRGPRWLWVMTHGIQFMWGLRQQ